MPTKCTCPESTGRNWAWTTLVCDTPEQFAPTMDGATADESAGYAWFTREEIADLPLHPGFKQSWEAVLRTRKDTRMQGKCAVRRVGLNGQEFWEHPDPCPCKNPMGGDHAAGGGGPQFMPHDAEGRQEGRVQSQRGGSAAGHDDMGGVQRPHGLSEPSGDDGRDSDLGPRSTGWPYTGMVNGYQGGFWPQGGHGTGQPDTWQPVASAPRGTGAGNGLRKQDTTLVAHGDAGDKVLAQMRENFPDSALGWLRRSHWTGPLDVALDDIDYSDKKQWSAWKEKFRVRHFENLIKDGEEFNPVVAVKVPSKARYRVVDGHHRALAYLNLGQPVHAYIGYIPDELIGQAEETHSSQLHSGSSAENE